MWIAKNKFTGEIYPESRSLLINNCQSWIDSHIDQFKLKKLYAKELATKDCEKLNDFSEYQEIEDFYLLQLVFRCNIVLCWNINQKRFCDGFDF